MDGMQMADVQLVASSYEPYLLRGSISVTNLQSRLRVNRVVLTITTLVYHQVGAP